MRRALDTNKHRMRYDEYLRLGYGIGSGAVESAHKQVTHARIRQAGMRWSEAGARRLLALRVLSGFDRLVFRGHLLPPMRAGGMFFFDTVSRPVIDGGRRFRALRIGDAEDPALLDGISRGEFATAGFRNRDIRLLLHSTSQTAAKQEQCRLSVHISRRLRLLRAHDLIKKINKPHRYQLTEPGRLLTAAARATRDASLKQLLSAVA